MPPNGDNGWLAWRERVLSELTDIEKRLRGLEHKVGKRQMEVEGRLTRIETSFQIKSGIWGLIAGSIPTAAAAVFWLMR